MPILLLILGWGSAVLVDKLGAWLEAVFKPARSRWTVPALGLVLAVTAAGTTAPFVLALLADPSRAPLPNEDRQGYVTNFGSGYGFPEAGGYLSRVAPPGAANWQVIALLISDEARLRAYLPADLWPRLRQVQIVGGQNQDTGQQMARLRTWLPEAAVTYVVVGSNTQWVTDWQAAFPQAVLAAQFYKPGDQDAVQILRITTP